MAHDYASNGSESPFFSPEKRHYTIVRVDFRGIEPDLPKGAKVASERAATEYSNYRGVQMAWWVIEVSGPRAADAMEEWFSDQKLDWFTRLKNAEAEAGDRSYGPFLGLGKEL